MIRDAASGSGDLVVDARTFSIVDLASVMHAYQRALLAHEHEINQLNVFPVPDGDTGTNMRSTLDSVLTALQEGCEDPNEVAHAIARGSLLGARGNSGIILAQYLRAMTESIGVESAVDAGGLAAVLRAATAAARSSVARPVEGTMLSVADGAAAGATEAYGDGDDLLGVATAGYRAAKAALWETPTQLPVLERAGVVDAGGAGLLLLFAAIVGCLRGDSGPLSMELPEPVATMLETSAAGVALDRLVGHGDGQPKYEVMFLFESDRASIDAFKTSWGAIGDSMVVVGDEPTWNCHIHTDDIGAAIEIAIEHGRPHEIRVTDLARQVAEEGWVSGSLANDKVVAIGAAREPDGSTTAVVAVADGAGLEAILQSLGSAVIVEAGATMSPSIKELLMGVDRTHASEVVLLPNNKNVVAIAHEVSRLHHKSVVVLETENVLEAIAAMVHFDPHKRAEENLCAMRAGLSEVRTGEVTHAVRNATTDLGEVRIGEYLAIAQSHVVSIGGDLATVATGLVDGLLEDGHEILSLYRGESLDEDAFSTVVEALTKVYPDLVIEPYVGGQHHAELLVALE